MGRQDWETEAFVLERTGGGFDDPIPFDTTQVTSPANRSQPRAGDPSHPLAAHAHAPAIAFSCKDHGADAGEVSPTLRGMSEVSGNANAGGQVAVITMAVRGRGDGRDLEIRDHGTANAILTPNGGRDGMGVGAIAFHNRQDPDVSGDVTHPIGRQDNGLGLGLGMKVRRLTPLECERLQGFPDGWTDVPYRGKPAADGPRYKALGNSMAVNVMRWIGERIASCPTYEEK